MTTSESSHGGRLKVAVTGAKGNAGPSLSEALAARDEIGEIVGLARRRLDRRPRVTASEAAAKPPEEIGHGAVRSTPAPDPASARLVKQLTDLHAIEEQALKQMRRGAKIAGDDRFVGIFEEHLTETEEQERRLRERLEAYGAEPSAPKNDAGGAGGTGMVVFAASRPDAPGKLAAHSFSYAHMEIATYELLRRTAEAAGDAATAAVARQTGAEEERMAGRLAGCFDAVIATSLNGGGPADVGTQLDRYLADAHAIEKQGLQLLETALGVIEGAGLKELFRRHLRESEEHERMARERLEARGARAAKSKNATLRIGGLQVGALFAAQPDTRAKLTAFCFAFEQLEIAAYELLGRMAVRAGDAKVTAVAARILDEERIAASKLGDELRDEETDHA